MRRLCVGLVVAVATVMVPLWAMASNQEVAQRIAANLKESGQMRGYQIKVKYQDGTAWLRGQVNSYSQLESAMDIVRRTPGVTKVVSNLTVADDETNTSSSDLQQTATATGTEQPVMPQIAEPSNMVSSAERQVSLITPITAEPTMAPRAQTAPLPPPTVAMASAPRAVARPAATRQAQPIPVAYTQGGPAPQAAQSVVSPQPVPEAVGQGVPMPQYVTPAGPGMTPAKYDQAYMPNHAWPAYASYPNYAAVTYPKQYSPTAWPYIGPFYPYPQVPLGWRKVSMEWHDGWWNLDFDDGSHKGPISGLFRPLGCK
jgi:hypothetical protein